MLSILIGVVAAVSFPGGTPAELAKSIAESTKTNVLVQSSPNENLKAFEYDPASMDEMAKAVNRATKLRRSAGQDNIFHGNRLLTRHFGIEAIKRLTMRGPRPPVTSFSPIFKEGKVTLQQGKGVGSSPMHLQNLVSSKPVQVDPFFEGLYFSAWISDLPERDFLNFIAKGIGGKVVMGKEGFRFEPHGPEVQRRALATLDEAKSNESFAKMDAHVKAELELTRAAIAAASPDQIAEVAKSEGSSIRMEIGPALRSAVTAYLMALVQAPPRQEAAFGPPDPPSGQRQVLENPNAERFRNLDRRILGIATLNPGFRVSLELATVDGLGRPGPPIRVP